MSDQSRSLPDRPDLRFLKIEAKRRLASGEFATLHAAQLAIAREHGMSSWTALKHSVETATASETSPALTHVRWVITRFQDADMPAWATPDVAELRAHFDDHYLSLVPVDTMIRQLTKVAPQLRNDLVVANATSDRVRAQVADLRVEAAADPEPPYRLTSLRLYPVGERVTDERTAEPPTHTSGAAPARAVEVVEESYAELGLVGLTVAGAAQGDPLWTTTRGWASLERRAELRTHHRFPAYGTTKLITSTAILRLIADGGVELDGPVNANLRTIRLADDDVTVRELLTHTGGVTSPEEQFAADVPDTAQLLGSTVACDHPRGTFTPSNAGYAVLGQLIADVTGTSCPEAVTRLVLAPLHMDSSSFPTTWPDTDAVTGYRLTDDGSFEPVPGQVCTMPAAAGLWTTAADLVRFGTGWSTLLPTDLAREALRPQAAQAATGADVGLGWLLNQRKDVSGHPGAGPGAAVSLIVRLGTGTATAACTNRLVPVEPVNARLSRPIA